MAQSKTRRCFKRLGAGRVCGGKVQAKYNPPTTDRYGLWKITHVCERCGWRYS